MLFLLLQGQALFAQRDIQFLLSCNTVKQQKMSLQVRVKKSADGGGERFLQSFTVSMRDTNGNLHISEPIEIGKRNMSYTLFTLKEIGVQDSVEAFLAKEILTFINESQIKTGSTSTFSIATFFYETGEKAYRLDIEKKTDSNYVLSYRKGEILRGEAIQLTTTPTSTVGKLELSVTKNNEKIVAAALQRIRLSETMMTDIAEELYIEAKNELLEIALRGKHIGYLRYQGLKDDATGKAYVLLRKKDLKDGETFSVQILSSDTASMLSQTNVNAFNKLLSMTRTANNSSDVNNSVSASNKKSDSINKITYTRQFKYDPPNKHCILPFISHFNVGQLLNSNLVETLTYSFTSAPKPKDTTTANTTSNSTTNTTSNTVTLQCITLFDQQKLGEIYAGSDFIDRKKFIDKFDIGSIQIAFENGAIKTALVSGTINNQEVMYRNMFPIPLQTIQQIHAFNTDDLNSLMTASPRFNTSLFGGSDDNSKKDDYPEFPLRRLLFYDLELALRGNYLPFDGIMEFKTFTTKPVQVEMRRRSFLEDFDVRFYTDLTGFQRDNPNGILQTELRYNIALNASNLSLPNADPLLKFFNRHVVPGTLWLGGLYGVIRSFIGEERRTNELPTLLPFSLAMMLTSYWYEYFPSTALERVTPFIHFARIEDRTSLLFPQEVVTAQKSTTASTQLPYIMNSNSSIASFDLWRYANFHAGFELNISKVHLENSNFDFIINASAGIFRTPVDSLQILDEKTNALVKRSDQLYSWFIMPEFQFSMINSANIDFNLIYSPIYTGLLSQYNVVVQKASTGSTTGASISAPTAEYNQITTFSSGTFIHKMQFNFNVFPDLQDRKSWFFIRASLFLNTPKLNFQLQGGITISLQNLFKTISSPSASSLSTMSSLR